MTNSKFRLDVPGISTAKPAASEEPQLEVKAKPGKAPLPEGLNLERFFGDRYDDFRRIGSDRAEEFIALVERRRAAQRCDLCGLPADKPTKPPKEMIGSYLCNACSRKLQRR